MPTRPNTNGGMISFHDKPAKKITANPAVITNSAVPKSGCFMMSATGNASNKPATTKSTGLRRPSRFWNHQASISGMAILRISLG